MLESEPVITKIPFRVSARTARLIGRENIATSKGAIIELVKNAYDADSSISIVFFDNEYSNFQSDISVDYYNTLLLKGVPLILIQKIYDQSENGYTAKHVISEDDRAEFNNIIKGFATLFLIDAGEGMTQNIIRKHWMTIGTDNKANNVFTKNGRVKAGAKGIGRFALDKLGGRCEMITVFNPKNHDEDTDEEGVPTNNTGYRWIVNWEDFEGDFKTIESVGADLIGIKPTSLKEVLINDLPALDLSQINSETEFKYGTVLKISELRDDWADYYVDQVYNDLEVLVPPKETGEFEIYVFSSLLPTKYGEVLGSICDDFDYKFHAVADENQKIVIKIYRNEYDVQTIDPKLFEREEMKKFPYTKKQFTDGFFEKELSFADLLPGWAEIDKDEIFKHIGVFDFTFYFLKRTYSTPDANRFFYKKFLSNARKDWLDKFGGVKLFRDNFRVRPYGERSDVAFDWLALGSRKAASPAGIGKEDGGWRVEPENVAGAVKISRLTNVDFEDKSSREGLQENKTFQIFKLMLTGLIKIFEEDRALIARQMSAFDNEKYGPERDRAQADKIAKRILQRDRTKKEQQRKDEGNQGSGSANESSKDESEDPEKVLLASEIERQEEEIERLKDEQKLLRGLASAGIVLASFSHDLSKVSDVMESRVDKVKNLLLEKIQPSDYNGIEERKNPFVQLEKFKKQDVKMQNWLKFSLGATRKDKRKRKQLFFPNYFENTKADWGSVFEERGIEFDISAIEELNMRVFEIDFDSIFNNLIVNSIDAFNISTYDRVRKIAVNAIGTEKEIIVEYYDNGPGLSANIQNPDVIFESLFTTKRDLHTGEEIGTGLGMWIVKSVVEENDGSVKLLFPSEGFGIRISFPVKYKKQNV